MPLLPVPIGLCRRQSVCSPAAAAGSLLYIRRRPHDASGRWQLRRMTASITLSVRRQPHDASGRWQLRRM